MEEGGGKLLGRQAAEGASFGRSVAPKLGTGTTKIANSANRDRAETTSLFDSHHDDD